MEIYLQYPERVKIWNVVNYNMLHCDKYSMYRILDELGSRFLAATENIIEISEDELGLISESFQKFGYKTPSDHNAYMETLTELRIKYVSKMFIQENEISL